MDIGFGVAGPTGKGPWSKILAILCVHRVLWLPWGALCASTGALLFMAQGAPLLPLWKLILGIFAAGLLTRVISQADMLYDWWTGEDERLGPPNSTLPLVTGLLSPKTVFFFMVVETIFCLWVALFIFNPTTFLLAVLMLIWGLTYSASPPLKRLTELQRRIYRSLSGLIVLGGIAMVAPERIISWETFVVSLAIIIGCLSYHDKDSMRFTPLTPKETISFTVVMSIFEYLWLMVLWQTFALNWAFLMLYVGLAIFKIRAISRAYNHHGEHKAHIKLTHVGVINYTIMLIIINMAAAYNILASV
ncbi:MAG: UbiA family prenyltransferase [Methanosarcinales archaeon Met12]|nr:MAG: UbiA family prenyltransferase [Methanosarcinales archaeon Met12]